MKKTIGMNNQFKKFLSNRPRDKTNECDHDREHWCTNCVNFGNQVSVVMEDGTISKGNIITNIDHAKRNNVSKKDSKKS